MSGGERDRLERWFKQIELEPDPNRQLDGARKLLAYCETVKPWPYALKSREVFCDFIHYNIAQLMMGATPPFSEAYIEEAHNHSRLAHRTFEHSHDSLGANHFVILSGIQFEIFKLKGGKDLFTTALRNAHRGISVAQKINDPRLAAMGFANAALIGLESPLQPFDRNLEQAIEYFENAYGISKHTADPNFIGDIGLQYLSSLEHSKSGDDAARLEQIKSIVSELKGLIAQDRSPALWARLQVMIAHAHLQEGPDPAGFNMQRAIQAADAAIDAFQTLGATQEWAMALLTKGNILADLGDQDPKNREAAVELMQLAKQHLDPVHAPSAWRSLHSSLANLVDDAPAGTRRQITESLKAELRAQLEKDKARNDQEQVAEAHLSLGGLYLNDHRDRRGPEGEKAIEHLEAALEYFSSDRRPLSWHVATGNLASAYALRSVGDPAENVERSISLLETTVSWSKSTKNTRAWIQSMRDLAVTLLDRVTGNPLDDLELALATLEEARVAATELIYPTARAQIQRDLARCFHARTRGDKQLNELEALRLYRSAQSLLSGKADFATLQSISASSHSILRSQKATLEPKDAPKASVSAYLKSFRDALEIARSTERISPLHEALVHYGDALGTLDTDQDTDDGLNWFEGTERMCLKAIDQYQQALSLISRDYDPDRYGAICERIAHTWSRLARLSSLNDIGFEQVPKLFTPMGGDRSEKTNTYFQHAIERLQASRDCYQVAGAVRATFGLTLELAHKHVLIRDWEKACEYYEEATRHPAQVESLAVLDDADLLLFVTRLNDLMEAGAYAFVQADRPMEALRYVDQMQARLLGRRLGYSLLDLPEDKSSLVDAYRREKRELETRLDAPEMFHRRPVIERIIKLKELISKLTSQSDEGTAHAFSEHLNSLLNDETALVVPVISSIGGAILLVTSENEKIDVTRIEANNEILLKQPFNGTDDGWLAHYERAHSGEDGSELDDLIETTFSRLRELFWGELASRLGTQVSPGANKLVLVPYGPTALIPWAAGPLADARGLLVDEFEISITPSIKSLAAARAQSKAKVRSGLALIATDPSTLSIGSDGHFDSECNFIKNCARDAKFLTRPKGEKQSVLSAISGASVWHFPGHGEFDAEKPMESYIKLNGIGELTLRDLHESDTVQPPELVILSACETAVYDEQAPNEFVGWPHAFLELGARGVISALWRVHALPTVLLMAKFYENLTRQSERALAVPSALRQSQLWLKSIDLKGLEAQVVHWGESNLLNAADRESLLSDLRKVDPAFNGLAFPEPVYWAGFAYYGDPALEVSLAARHSA